MSDRIVIYIGGFEFPDGNAATQRVLANAHILKHAGYQTVFIGIDRSLDYSIGLSDRPKEIQGFTYWSKPYPKSITHWGNYLTSIRAFKKVAHAYTNIHAVISYNYPAFAMERIRGFCKKNNILFLSDCTEWPLNDSGNILYRAIKSFDTKMRMHFSNTHADGLILASHYLANLYPKTQKAVVPSLVPDALSKKHPNANQRTANEIPHLVYAGIPFRLGSIIQSTNELKDRLDLVVDLLFKIDKENIPFHFDIYGITKEEYISSIPRHKEKVHSLQKRIIFHGRCNKEKLLERIRISDFSIFLREKTRVTEAGFPTKFSESMVCGTPVITTNTSDLENYLNEGKNGYFLDLRDLEIAKEKLKTILLTSKQDRKAMKKYTIENNPLALSKWLHSFDGLLDR